MILEILSLVLMRIRSQCEVFAGLDETGYLDGDNSNARFNGPCGILRYDEHLIVTEMHNNCVRKVSDISTTTLAGTTVAGYNDGIGSEAQFEEPNFIAVDSEIEAVLLTDFKNGRVRSINATGYVDTLFTIYAPVGIAIGGDHIYVGSSAGKIYKCRKDSLTCIEFAGRGGQGYVDGTASNAMFSTPFGIAFDHTTDTLYVADHSNNRVRSIHNGEVATIAYIYKIGDVAITDKGTLLALSLPGYLHEIDGNSTIAVAYIPSVGHGLHVEGSNVYVTGDNRIWKCDIPDLLPPSKSPSMQHTNPPTISPSVQPTTISPSVQPTTCPNLLICVAACDMEAANKLLEEDVNSKNIHDQTSLMIASINQCPSSIAYLLLIAGADCNVQDVYGKTAIIYAVIANEALLVEELVECTEDIALPDNNGKNAKWYATDAGYDEIVLLLETSSPTETSAVYEEPWFWIIISVIVLIVIIVMVIVAYLSYKYTKNVSETYLM